MRKFILKIFIVGFPIVLFLLIGEYAIRKIPNDYALKNKYLNENAPNLKTLVMGSSHIYYGVNPEQLNQPAFNAAMVSQPLDFDLKIIEKYQSELRNLETLILSISYFSFFSTLENVGEGWRRQKYNIYYGIGSPLKFEISNRTGKEKISEVFGYYFNNRNLKLADSLGWGSSNIESSNQLLQLSGLKAAKRHTAENYDLLAFQLKNLRRIIQIANENNWDVVLITPPAYHSYVDNLKEEQLNLTTRYCEQFAKDFDNVFYYNFLQDSSFCTSDFFDADHLNKAGANKFSQILNEKIKS